MTRIEYTNYLPNGEIMRICKIEFLTKNRYRFTKTYERNNLEESWYTEYDLVNDHYYKFEKNSDLLIKQGTASFGRFQMVDQSYHSKLKFHSYTSYNGLDAIEYMESSNRFESRQVALNNAFLENYIDAKYIFKLPISVHKSTGKEFNNYGILALRETKYAGQFIRMFDISKIDIDNE